MRRGSRQGPETKKGRSLSVGGILGRARLMIGLLWDTGSGNGDWNWLGEVWHCTEFLVEHSIYRLCNDLDESLRVSFQGR
jgi:hypothetical protein